jgi:hypothetical protein
MSDEHQETISEISPRCLSGEGIEYQADWRCFPQTIQPEPGIELVTAREMPLPQIPPEEDNLEDNLIAHAKAERRVWKLQRKTFLIFLSIFVTLVIIGALGAVVGILSYRLSSSHRFVTALYYHRRFIDPSLSQPKLDDKHNFIVPNCE